MTKVSAVFAASIFSLLLLACIPTVGAQTGTITASFGDIEYVVHLYDTTDQPTFEVTFTDSKITSNYEFNANAFVRTIKAGSEKYRISYRNNGDLREVKRMSSRRQLEEKQDDADFARFHESVSTALGVMSQTAPAPDGRRLLLECDKCVQTWSAACNNGVATVCALEGFGSPILSVGEASIGVFCNDFGTLCKQRTAEKVCKVECGLVKQPCYPPLTITLEYEQLWHSAYSTGESDASFLFLYVIEPGGQTAYWDNRETVREPGNSLAG